MSERNGDRARFQKIRKGKLRHRQRTRALMARLPKKTDEETSGAVDGGASAIAQTSSLPTIGHTGHARSKRSGH
jgi:hypothetical protein